MRTELAFVGFSSSTAYLTSRSFWKWSPAIMINCRTTFRTKLWICSIGIALKARMISIHADVSFVALE